MSPPQNLALLPIQVTDQGFDANGNAVANLTRTLVTTARIFNAWSALGADTELTLTADKVAASDVLYSTSSVGGIDTSACPASPKPVMKWRLPDGFVVGNSIRQRIGAFHRDGMACVEAWATDGLGGETAHVFVSEYAATMEAGDRWFANEFEVTVPLAGLSTTAGTAVTLHARGYPRLGNAASIRSTADETLPERFSPRSYIRDTSRATAPFIVAVAAGGNDTNGAVSQNQATAYASPCATPKGALNRIAAVLGAGAGSAGAEVHLDAGTWQLDANPSVNANTAFITIRPKVGVAKANCTWSFAASAATHPRATLIRYKGLKLLRSVDGKLCNATGGHCVVEDCDLDVNGLHSALVTATSGACGLTFTGGCTISGITASGLASLLQGSTGQAIRLLRGTTIALNASFPANPTAVELYNAVACTFENVTSNNGALRNQSGRIMEACAFNKLQSTNAPLVAVGGTGATSGTADGFAIVNNAFEYIAGGSSSASSLAPSADNMLESTNHAIILNNTSAGFDIFGRWNVFYNETTGTARTHTLMRFEGNLPTQINTKHDVFCGENKGLADAATRTGGWSFLYGVGCQGNFTLHQCSFGAFGRDGDGQLYAGAGSIIGTSNTAKNDPLFVDPRHTTWAGSGAQGANATAGAGGSNLRLQAGSPARGIVTVKPWTPKYDMDGAVRTGGATCAAGAWV